MLMADPRIVENPKTIEEITYRELRELSYMGATVLHDEAIFPVRKAHIPINIRNTNRPQDPGTMIVPKAQSNVVDTVITGVAGKCGMTAVNIEEDMRNAEIGFGKKVLEVLEQHDLSFEHLPSGIDTMTVIINSAALIECKGAVTAEIVKKVNPDSITVAENLALIAVVGRGLIGTVGSAARVFTALSRHGVDVKMIDQGSSQISVIIGVDEKKYEDAIRAIYDEFVK
jgi:aspartate kinase